MAFTGSEITFLVSWGGNTEIIKYRYIVQLYSNLCSQNTNRKGERSKCSAIFCKYFQKMEANLNTKGSYTHIVSEALPGPSI